MIGPGIFKLFTVVSALTLCLTAGLFQAGAIEGPTPMPSAAPFGTVVDQNGTPLAGVSVMIYDRTGRSTMSLTTTDSLGMWAAVELSPTQTYSVRYYHPLYSFAEQFQLIPAESTQSDMGTVTASARTEFIGVDTPDGDFIYEMARDGSPACTITGYTGESSTVVVPETLGGYPVTTIGKNAFLGSNIAHVALPNTLTTIQEAAFRDTDLVTIDLPNTLTASGKNSFYTCSSLTRADLPDGLSGMGNAMFAGCSALHTVNIPAGLIASFVDEMFSCFPIFSGCESLTHVVIPDGVTSVASYLFHSATYLQSVDLPDSLTEIGGSVFYNCQALTSIDIPDGVTSIGQDAFNQSALTEVHLPAGVTVHEDAFRYCSALTCVTFTGDQPVTLHAGAFSACSALTRVDMPVHLEAVIPKYGEDEANLFQSCESLTEIVLPEGTTALPDYALSGCETLTSIQLPSTLTSIGSCAFKGCTSLPKLTIPEAVTAIGSGAFQRCLNLTAVNIPKGVTALEDALFYYCRSLTEISVPERVTTIGENAFACSGLTAIRLPADLVSIGKSAFSDCAALREVLFTGSSLTQIESYAFQSCASLKSVALPDSVSTLGHDVFASCTMLREINIPLSLTAIGASVFEICPSLSVITVPEGMTALPDQMFCRNNDLRIVILPDSITYIGENAFSDTQELHQVWIGENVTTVAEDAFENAGAYLTIHGVAGSWIEAYARQNSIPFSSEPITVRRTAAPSGRVTDPDGQPLPGVDVMVYDRTSGVTLTQTTTDENGAWSGEWLLDGHYYSVRYYHPLYRFDSQMHTIHAGADREDIGTTIGTLRPEFIGVTTSPTDFEYEANADGTCTINRCLGDSPVVIFPEELDGYTVTSLSCDASHLTAAALPVTLNWIESKCFYAGNLKWVDLPNRLTLVSSSAFSYSDLKTASLPDDAQLGHEVFLGCTALNQVNVPARLALGNQVFHSCGDRLQLVIPEGVTRLPDWIFNRCYTLSSVKLPDTLEWIGRNAFYSCFDLTEIDIPNSVTFIGGDAFSCSGLTEVVLPAALAEMDSGVFAYCSALEKVTFAGNQLELIGYRMFHSCSALTRLEIPDSVTSIGDAFPNCESLTDVIIGPNVRQLHDDAFENCPKLTITCPEGSKTAEFCAQNGIKTNLIHGIPIEPDSTVELTLSVHDNGTAYITANQMTDIWEPFDQYLMAAVYDENGTIMALHMKTAPAYNPTYLSLSMELDPFAAYRVLVCLLDPVTLAPVCKSIDLAI